MVEWLGISLSGFEVLAALAFGYLLGSVPFGLLLTRAAGLGDVRAIGSGNIGATNVLRTGNKSLAAATLLLDLLKGTAAVWVASRFGWDAAMFASLGAFLGHVYPAWLRFKGGKGVATFLGVLLGVSWKIALLFAAVWVAVAFVFRFSSLSALTAALVAFVAIAFRAPWLMVVIYALMTVILFHKHRTNIQRLITGDEPKIGDKG